MEIEMSEVLTYQEAERVYAAINEALDWNDPDVVGLYDDMIMYAARYSNIRVGWNVLTREQKMETDSRRTAAHDAFIVSLNIVARIQGEAGAKWKECLTDDRKRVGDFACYIALFRGLEAR